MTTLKVPGMHCNMCVSRIEKAMAAAEIKCKISLEGKTVEVEDEKTELAINELDDLGFEAIR